MLSISTRKEFQMTVLPSSGGSTVPPYSVSEMIRHIFGMHSSQQNTEEISYPYLSATV